MFEREEVDVLDCGNEVASWLSKVIFEKDAGLRLGVYPDSSERQRTFDTGPYRDHPFLKKTMDDNDFVSMINRIECFNYSVKIIESTI